MHNLTFGFFDDSGLPRDPLKMYLEDIFTISANLAGIPGISVPCGFSRDNMPIGLQLMGDHFSEETLMKVAYTFEQATDFHKKRPEKVE